MCLLLWGRIKAKGDTKSIKSQAVMIKALTRFKPLNGVYDFKVPSLMCMTAVCWKVLWKKCLLMCCALGASLRAALWTHYQTDRWRLLMLIGVLTLASIAWMFLLTGRAAALTEAHFRSWVGRKSRRKVEKRPSVAKWNSFSFALWSNWQLLSVKTSVYHRLGTAAATLKPTTTQPQLWPLYPLHNFF